MEFVKKQTESEPNYVDFFLLIMHGTNVSGHMNYYPFEVKYKSLVTYTKPSSLLALEELKTYFKSPCTLLRGHCPHIPILDKTTGKKVVYLQPLVFSVNAKDPENIKEYIGLHHYRIARINEPDAEINEFDIGKSRCIIVDKDGNPTVNNVGETIYTHANLVSRFGSNNRVTYSQIFQLVDKTCKERGISPENIIFGIASCQLTAEDYSLEYDITDTRSLIPNIVENHLPKTNIVNDITEIEPTSKVSPCIIQVEDISISWTALAKITHQGCGLNVLSFYGLIETKSAREKAVCLTLNGTSIFKIVDYIDDYIKESGTENLGYTITRTDMQNGIYQILHAIITCLNERNSVIIFKIYENYYQKNSSLKFNHRGHTISIAKIAKYHGIYLVDPQISYVTLLHDTETTLTSKTFEHLVESTTKLIKEKYEGKDTIDVIWTVKKPGDHFQEGRYVSTVEVLFRNYPNILNRDESIHYGGKKRSKKHRKHGRKTKYIKLSNPFSNRVRLKRRILTQRIKYGGNLDAFEQLTKRIDAKAGIHSNLIVTDADK